MTHQQLHEKLRQLHADLQQAQTVDADERELLQSLMKDVQNLLERSGEQPAQHYQPLSRRLGEAILRFEISHPTLTASMGQVIDALNQIGI